MGRDSVPIGLLWGALTLLSCGSQLEAAENARKPEAKAARPIGAEPRHSKVESEMPAGHAEAFFVANTGADQLGGAARQTGLEVVVRWAHDELRQTVASCSEVGLGSALGGRTGEILEVALCDGEFWLTREQQGVAVLEVEAEQQRRKVVARIALPRTIATIGTRAKP